MNKIVLFFFNFNCKTIIILNFTFVIKKSKKHFLTFIDIIINKIIKKLIISFKY